MKLLFTLISVILMTFANTSVKGQANVLNPNDPDVIFTSSFQPAAPAWNNYNINKWGHSTVLDWNPFNYGYKSYIYKGMVFRLKFPKSYKHNVADGKIYPVLVFLHGLGEWANIYNNELQLLHGGQTFGDHVNDSTFDGFILCPQSNSGTLQGYFGVIGEVLDTMAKYVKVDPDRVNVNGLSAGGQATWEIVQTPENARRYSSITPISAAANPYVDKMPTFLTVPVWVANGGQDNNPAPGIVDYLIDTFKKLGGNIAHSLYPNEGHGCWYSFWAEPGFWPFINAAHKANPLVYYQRTAFCPNEAVSVKLALQPGFFAYEWQKDNITIAGANSDTLHVSAYGQYRGRFKRTASSNWSLWSPLPVNITQKQGTVTPPIQIGGMYSSVLPAPDGSTTVPLALPTTYASYEWRRVNDNALVSNSSTYNAPVGQYKAMVTEQFGCSSDFSAPFSVISANGANLPDKASNLSAIAMSYSTVQLDWNDNPAPLYNETAFEVYRSTTQGSNYKLVAVKPADVISHLDSGLAANTKYYYVIRAVNAGGASVISSEVNATTKSDLIAPSAPTNLVVTTSTLNSVTIAWDPSTDNIGVYKYDIYVNGTKTYSISAPTTTFTINGLTALQPYAFSVKARDVTGNISPFSNQVTGVPVLTGINYKYYQGSDWLQLPDFNAITPVASGITANIDLNLRQSEDYFGFLWQGNIVIPATGTYTFQTISDDGSRLYIDVPYSYGATPVVDNDGLHGDVAVQGSIFLTAGMHSIAATFFERNGGQTMRVYWQCAAAGIPDLVQIPDNAFANQVTLPAPSAKPGFLVATATSYKSITLNWADNSTDETGFEIVRSNQQNGTYLPVGTVGAGVTSYVDSVGLTGGTKYWYKIRSVNVNGQSAFISTVEANWPMNGDFTDISGSVNAATRTLTGVGAPTFTAVDKKEGTQSLSLNGTSQYADMPFSASGAFPSNGYVTRTVSLWIKPTATTVSAANKIIFDLGGSDNGVALRFNTNTLQAGLASGGIRYTATVNAIASDVNWVNGGWNHVAVVYNVNVLKVFVNGVEKVSTSLGVSSLAASTGLSRLGATNGSNAFNSSAANTNYGGLIDDVLILTEPVNPASDSSLMTQTLQADTTFDLPAVPTTPSNLIPTAQSPFNISLKWNDNSNNETSFEIYRSAITNNSFRLLAVIDPNNTSQVTYNDNGLFANTNYYYKVRAVGLGGNSVFTSEAMTRTLDNKPVINKVASFSMRYASQKTVAFTATDVDGENLSMTALNVPSFATFTGGNGTASLLLNPTVGNLGSFSMSVIAADGNGGKDTTAFTITVNANYQPVATPVNNITISEGANTNYPLSATDQDGNGTLVWSLVSPPSFAGISGNINGAATLNLHPGYAHAGNYTLTAKVSDGTDGLATILINVTVTDAPPASEKTYISIKNSTSPAASAPWNNITGAVSSNLLNSSGISTSTGLQFVGGAWNTYDQGAVTGNNSGVYPDAVIKDYYYFGIFGAPETVDMKITGLSTLAKYNVTLFASSAYTGVVDNGTTVYSINGVQKSLYVHYNTQNTVTFSSLSPDASGNITVNMSKAAGTQVGYLTALVLDKPFDDLTTPILPVNLAAEALSNGYVKLTWKDLAYNENNYLVYRSTSAAGPFTVLNAGASNANDTTYTDNTVLSSTTYYYKIAATNNYGTSGQTGSVSATTVNKVPVFNALNDVFVKAAASTVVNINATDDAGDVLTIAVSNLPAFASYQNISNGTGKITVSPGINDLGVYKNVTVKITDNYGASITRTFDIYVADNSTRSVYVNFGPQPSEGGVPQAAPWNNSLAYPFANLLVNNLNDDVGVNTGFSVKLLEQWDRNFMYGMTTGDNSGIFPDNVIQGSINTSSTSARTMEFAGLNPAKKYNLVFFCSTNAGDDGSVIFANGAQSVTLNARYNSNKTVQLNGLTPNASGVLQATITKGASASFINLNAVVIQEYTSAATPLRPTNLFAESDLAGDRINLTWADRANNETGYKIYRSTSQNGSYSLVTTTAANATTYINTGLSGNTKYYYKVSAVNGSGESNFTNIASSIISGKTTLINIDVSFTQGAPWNSTDAAPTNGYTLGNLKDKTSLSTGVDMVVTKQFNGEHYSGITGQNGIFPDNVQKSSWWNDAGQQSQIKFTKLDQTKRYRIGIFSSSDWFSYMFGSYVINGRTALLNSYRNNSKVVYLDNISPNADGEITMDVSTGAGSPYSFLGAITIESYSNTIPSSGAPESGDSSGNNMMIPSQPSGTDVVGTDDGRTGVGTQAGTAVVTGSSSLIASPVVMHEVASDAIKVFPNPFASKIQVEVNNKTASSVTIMLYDLNSKLVYRSGSLNVTAGKAVVSLNLPGGAAIAPGSYYVNVLIDGKLTSSVKLIKVN
ncbi:MAG: fibronectin type III domain-containing protein [Ferruginibacter sp.]